MPMQSSYTCPQLQGTNSCMSQVTVEVVGFGGLVVMCLPRDPRFADSNPAEVDGFSWDVKILSTSPPGETLSQGS